MSAPTVADHLAAIERELAVAKAENEKLVKGQKAAGPKVRNALLDIGKTVSEARKDVLEIGKAIPVKKRQPKAEVKADELLPSSGDEAPEQAPVAEAAQLAEPLAAPAPAKKPRASRAKKVAVPSMVVPAAQVAEAKSG